MGATKDEEIHETIFKTSYNRHALPADTATEVKLSLLLLNIEEVNPFEGTVRLKVGLEAEWMDSRLAWDHLSSIKERGKTYANGDFMQGKDVIWMPDFEYNGGTRTNFYREMDP